MAHNLFFPDGSPKKKYVKSDVRQGITGIPMEHGDLEINQNLPVLHLYIHILKHFEHIGYTFNARYAFEDPDHPKQGMGTTKTEEEKAYVQISKEEFKTKAKDKEGLNLPLDSMILAKLTSKIDIFQNLVM